MANIKEYATRFGMLTMAALFLVTSIAFTAVIFWQSKNEDDNTNLTADLQEQLNQQLADQADNQSTEENAAMLEGTQLADFTPINGAVTELQKTDLVEGTGEEVKPGATVTAHYTGAYAVNGQIFQSSHDSGEPIPFGLDQVIAGWTQGVPGMKVGGKRRLVIPGNLAYGEAPEGYTPGSTERPMGPLVFDIELTAVQNP